MSLLQLTLDEQVARHSGGDPGCIWRVFLTVNLKLTWWNWVDGKHILGVIFIKRIFEQPIYNLIKELSIKHCSRFYFLFMFTYIYIHIYINTYIYTCICTIACQHIHLYIVIHHFIIATWSMNKINSIKRSVLRISPKHPSALQMLAFIYCGGSWMLWANNLKTSVPKGWIFEFTFGGILVP